MKEMFIRIIGFLITAVSATVMLLSFPIILFIPEIMVAAIVGVVWMMICLIGMIYGLTVVVNGSFKS